MTFMGKKSKVNFQFITIMQPKLHGIGKKVFLFLLQITIELI